MTSKHYDVIIIGMGPAGLTAALYSARLGLKTIVFGTVPGGSTNMIESLDNFPGFPDSISGTRFGVQAYQQAERQGAVFTMTRLQRFEGTAGNFAATDTEEQQYTSRGAIIATGRIPRRLKVPNARVKGIHFCSLCDGPLYRGRNATLAVIGSDNTAGQHALTLARLAEKVLLVSREERFSMDDSLIRRIKEQRRIELHPDTEVVDYEGGETIEGIVVRDRESEKKTIPVDGVFLVIGWRTNTKFIQFPLDQTPAGYLKTDAKLMTSTPGLFAAGDVRESDMYQVLTACADGARAAKHCAEFLED